MRKVTAILTDNIQLGIRVLGQHLFRFLEDILVVSSGKAFVGRDDQTAEGSVQRVGIMVIRVEKRTFHIPYRTENPLDLRPQCVKVGTYLFQIAARFAQFGGSDQIHRVGDLFGILDAFDMGFDFFCAGHRQSPHFSAALKLSR